MTKTRFLFPLLSGLTLLAAACGSEMESPGESDTDEAINALTTPVPCAVAKPSGLQITPPWAPGVTHTIWHGYGTGKHLNACHLYKSNDQFALDFDLTLGESVRPIAPGIVKYAGPATGGWDGYGNIVFIEHIVDGVAYHSLYAHLNSVNVTKGQSVQRSTTIGGAGWSGLSDPSATHLHLAVYKGALFQESPSGTGPYGGKAMVPEVMTKCTKNGGSSCENLVAGDVLTREATSSSCGSSCTVCILNARPDILPFYQANGWDTSCGNRDNIVNNWCGIDPAGCNAVKNGICSAQCL